MTRKNPERQQELVTVAQQLFSTKGYENTSINDIAQAASVTKGAFYHHFDSKTAVLEAIVAQLVGQVIANLQTIIADETLSAIPKWQKVIQLSNNWKIERKAELIAANRLMMMDENILLRHKIQLETRKVIAAEMGKIISQGVDEAVFGVEHVAETAVILMAVISSFNDAMVELLLNPDQHEDPATIALQKNAAVQTAVERLLNAPPGSMPIIDNDTLITWFDNP